MPIIKKFNNGTVISQDRGKIDDWCIYVNGTAPRDRDYLRELRSLGDDFGLNVVYADFKRLYDNTGENVEDNILNEMIPDISANYGDRSLEVEILFTTLYMVLLAEQNRYFGRTKTKLGKRIKGIAIYQIFFEDFTIEEACDYCVGRPWGEIAALCDERDLAR